MVLLLNGQLAGGVAESREVSCRLMWVMVVLGMEGWVFENREARVVGGGGVFFS